MQCTLCPVECGADREKRAGRCGVKGLSVAKYYLHPYEEPPISYLRGSGTVFFGGCSLKCAFCQNYEVSRARRGKELTPKELAEIFIQLENLGAENVNLVTPDHVSDLIAEALAYRKPNIPVVYNSGGYAKVGALERIAPYVDVWLPDVKFFSPALSARYTGREDYFRYASEAVAFMAQKKPAWAGGKMLSGILVRHLVMPACSSDSLRILDFLKETLPDGAPVSLMRQYTPMGEIANFPELNRKITAREYGRVVDYAQSLGFTNLYTQDKSSAETAFIPQWDF
jgi:putative pyruvate formate lyase activating enzyme